MHQETDNPTPIFYKLTTGEDIVAYQLSETQHTLLIKQPMVILVENDFGAARQLLNVREWLPPVITKKDEVSLPKKLIVFSIEVNAEFKEEFKQVVAYFYGVKPKRKARREAGDSKVVPFTFVKDESGKTH